MIQRIREYVKSYSPIYWISILLIVLLSLVLFLSNNFSFTPSRQMIQVAVSDSEHIKTKLSDTKETFAAYETMFSRLADSLYRDDENWASDFNAQARILFDGFYELNPHVSGCFISIDGVDASPLLQTYVDLRTGKESHISVFVDASFIYGGGGLNDRLKTHKEPIFITVPSSFVGGFELSYVVPLYIRDEYRGLLGIVLDKSSLSGMFGEYADRERQMMLLTPKLEIISSTADLPIGSSLESQGYPRYKELAEKIRNSEDATGRVSGHFEGQDWMYIFVRLPSGQIFLESFQLLQWLLVTNIMIFLLSLLALICIWFLQKRNGISPFDRLVNVALIKMQRRSEEAEIADKASFAIHITIVFITLVLLIHSFINGAALTEKITFLVYFILSSILLIWYRKTERSLPVKYAYVSFFLLAPVAVHLITGGFDAASAGHVILFSVMAVILSSYVLRNPKELGIFPLFVVVLFSDAIIEIATTDMSSSDTAIRFITVIFFLGFSMFFSTELYVTGITDILMRLKKTQSMLVQKERMVTLGRLIAGIAHEINTPLGAIKASVENANSALQPAFLALMESGQRLNESDRDLFFRLLDIEYASMDDMYTPMQIRKARPVIREFFMELGYVDPQDIVEIMIRLDICNIELIRQNRSIFESANMRDLLTLLSKTAPIVRGFYIISQATAKTSKTVYALKSYSHTAAPSELIWMDVVQNIDNVLVLLYNQIKSGIELVREYDEDTPKILGRPDELSQVWINLIQNAIQAMNGTGKLIIRIKKEMDAILVSISDDGCGIATDAIGHIFEPFYTTKDVGEGTGLGLDICKNIVTAHNGTIQAENGAIAGATFTVRLPLSL